jgi:hypothetical protein
MSEIEDQKQPGGIEIKELPYEKGLKILELDNKEVEKIGKNINDFFQKINEKRNRSINRNPITMLKGAIFAVGTKDLNNPEFKEHCASSLREIFHVWTGLNGLQNDYRDFYNIHIQNINDKLKELWNYYEFFSGVDHHEQVRWRRALESIKKITTKHTTGLDDDEFIELVKKFFIILKEIFI